MHELRGTKKAGGKQKSKPKTALINKGREGLNKSRSTLCKRQANSGRPMRTRKKTKHRSKERRQVSSETKQDKATAKRTSAFRGSQHLDTPHPRGRQSKGTTPKTRKKRTAYSRPQLTVRMETPSRSVKKLPGHRDLESRKQRAEVQHHVSARSIVEKTRKNEGKRPRLPQN